MKKRAREETDQEDASRSEKKAKISSSSSLSSSSLALSSSSSSIVRSITKLPKQKKPSTFLQKVILEFVYQDLVLTIISYLFTPEFNLNRMIGEKRTENGTFNEETYRDGELKEPYGICLHQDELFVADEGNRCVQVFHLLTGRFLRSWGNYGLGEGTFQKPTSITVLDGEVYVTDAWRQDVQIFSLFDSKFIRNCGGEFVFEYPTDICSSFDEEHSIHRLFLCDDYSGHNRVIMSTSTKYSRVFDLNRVESRHPTQTIPLRSCKKISLDKSELFLPQTRPNSILVVDIGTGFTIREYEIEQPYCAIPCYDELIVYGYNPSRLEVLDRETGRVLRRFVCPNQKSLYCDLKINVEQNELFACNYHAGRVEIFQ